ncbi:MAG: D-alanine--D-alanine ligase family protein [Clostridia bacterium]
MKKTVAVIFGGQSSEYEVSLMSSTFIIKNLDKNIYDIKTLGITKDGNWLLYKGDAENIENGTWVNDPYNTPAFISPDKNIGGMVVIGKEKTEIIPLDLIIPVLHGKNGEDGTIQGLFKLSGIPYVGCNTLSSAVCMDKAVTHSLLTAANIKQATYLWFYSDKFINQQDKDKIINKINARLNFPVFVKPANAGSSVGVSKVNKIEDLENAILKASKEDIKIVVEEGIVGKEVECAVMGNRDAVASPIGEIDASAEFYDYDDKYNNGTSVSYIPARIDENITDEIAKIAVRAYKILGCAGLSRVDFFVTEKNEIILNEINTLPGFTSISMYPKLWMSTGISAKELINNLIETAFNRYE